jgi:3-oxo-5-alpha-steroid 4-dehydrogenase 1
MNEADLFQILVYGWLGIAAVTFVSLQFLSAPYGRHGRAGWGPTMHRTAGWVIMEFPALLVPLVLGFAACGCHRPAAYVLLGLFTLHYANRTLIFPFRMRGGNIRMPVAIAAMGFSFNMVNGYMQGRFLFTLGPAKELAWLTDPRFIVGAIMFLSGFAINLQSDSILRNLRKPSETGYKIPTGGLFRWVSCPNYAGELLEWTGWAIATWSLPGLAFALWTGANLIPRAVQHHRWYREKFADYPGNRKAIIPFVY